MKVLIYSIILLFSVQTFARGGDKGFKVLEGLDLSKEQLEKIEKFKIEQKEKRKAMMGSKENHREKMKNLFIEGASDSEMRKVHESIKNHRGAHAEMKLEKMIFLKNLLNKEQRKTYIEKVKDHRKGKKRRGPRKD